jgi:hypothetical protein
MLKILKDGIPIIFLSISIIVLFNITFKILDKRTINEKIIEKEVIVEKNCISVDKFNKLDKKISILESELLNLKKENNKLSNMVIYFLEENKNDITIEEITEEETGTTIKWPPSFKINFTAPSKSKN